ncbi:MAG: twin-arginine translocase subunit TatC [Pirellulales bacterium]|nr:twin-arginine translocase subunit TatC [Pirellulales bacterium]
MPLKTDQDLFTNSTMTFGEHLDELRVCLFRALLGLLVAFGLVLLLGLPDRVIKFIEGPLGDSLQEFYLSQSEGHVEESLNRLREAGHAAPDINLIREAITVDRLLPEVDFVDARQTWDSLAQTYGVNAATSVIPDFARNDILSPTELCQQVLAGRDADGENPGKRVWELLDQPAQQLVTKIADLQADQVTQEDHGALAAGIKGLILENEDFYRQDDFSEIRETEPVTDFLAADKLAKRQHARLEQAENNRDSYTPVQFNALLLTAAFPDMIAAGPRRNSMMMLIRWHRIEDDPRISIKSLGVHEAFMIWLKAAIMVSLVIASPWVFWQIWSFVASGLYKHERRYIHLFLPISVLLFIGGAALCFFFVFHYVIGFLLSFNAGSGIDPDIRISEWFGMALFLPIGFGISFQLPLVMLFLQRIGIFSVKAYLQKWRVAVLVICVIAMLLTPADPWSMVLMAAPLVVLYFGGILLCRFWPNSRNPFRDADLTT